MRPFIVKSSHSESGFTLVELLAVIGIMAILLIATLPAVSSIMQSGGINNAVSTLSAEIELARSYAMANRTYVRMGFAYNTSTPPALVCVFLASADGTLQEATDTQMASTNPIYWSEISKPIVLPNIQLASLNATTPDTTDDARLNQVLPPPQIPIGPVTGRSFAGQNLPYGVNLGFLQFLSDGEVNLGTGSPFRFLSIGIETQNSAKNSAILRVSGVAGTVQTLRSENGVH